MKKLIIVCAALAALLLIFAACGGRGELLDLPEAESLTVTSGSLADKAGTTVFVTAPDEIDKMLSGLKTARWKRGAAAAGEPADWLCRLEFGGATVFIVGPDEIAWDGSLWHTADRTVLDLGVYERYFRPLPDKGTPPPDFTSAPTPAVTPDVTPVPTPAPELTEDWQKAYAELVSRRVAEYDPGWSSNILALDLKDFTGDGVPELLLYTEGGGASGGLELYVMEDGELRAFCKNCMDGMPLAANAVGGRLSTNYGAANADLDWPYLRLFDDGWLIGSYNADPIGSFYDWYRPGADADGRLTLEKLISFETEGAEGEGDHGENVARWTVNGEEVSRAKFYAARAAFLIELMEKTEYYVRWDGAVRDCGAAPDLEKFERDARGLLASWDPDVPAAFASQRDPSLDGALTQAELDALNLWFDPMFARDNVLSPTEMSCFFTSWYDRAEDLDLREFLRYYPNGTVTEEADEFEALSKLDNWPFPGAESADKMPVPIHRIPRANVDATLSEYAGITTADLTGVGAERLIYLKEFDAYYNFTSDFGPGTFKATRGERDGDNITLYNETDGGTAVLRLENVGGRWLIRSHTLIVS